MESIIATVNAFIFSICLVWKSTNHFCFLLVFFFSEGDNDDVVITMKMMTVLVK